MKKCHIAYLACTAALLGTGLGAAPPAAAHRIHLVKPGESIQKAVDAAQPGDTVLLSPGVHHESVTVSTPGLTLRGMGGRTVLEPAADAAQTTGTAKTPSTAKAPGTAKTPARSSPRPSAPAPRAATASASSAPGATASRTSPSPP